MIFLLPLSTALFIAISGDGKKVWFTEWASNEVAYLDTTIPIPLTIQVSKNYSNSTNSNPVLVLKQNKPRILDILLKRSNDDNSAADAVPNSSTPQRYISFNDVVLSIIGMSDSGITGIAYTAQSQQIDMENKSIARSEIAIDIGSGNGGVVKPGQYTAMVRASALENKTNNLQVSVLYPIQIRLDVPASSQLQLLQQQQQQLSQHTYSTNIVANNQVPVGLFDFSSLRGLLRILALSAAIALIAYIAYTRAKRARKLAKQKEQENKS